MRKIIIGSCLLVLLAGLGAGGYFGYQVWLEHQFRTQPPSTPGADVTFRVPKGTSFGAVATDLVRQGLVTDRARFMRLAREKQLTGRIRAGQFVLNTGWLPDRILEVLTTSAGVMVRLSVREGLTWWQTGAKVEQAGLGLAQNFGDAVNDPEFLRNHGILDPTAEGYLFPDTYLLTPPQDDHSRQVAAMMIEEFFRNAAELWPSGLPEWKEIHRVVTLASLVEKETGDPAERRRIAGVFANRLKRGMLLQADPTIIYGLGNGFDGNITRTHLRDKDNPYNTYTHRGLPPGPICSPGMASLRAALDPEQHRFLYFVAKGDGTHHFSATLVEHNEAVARYQLRRNRRTYRSTKE